MEGVRAAAAAEADRAARRLAGTTAGVLFIVGGLIAVLDGLWLVNADGVLVGELVSAGLLAMATGMLLLRLPWQRWSQWAALWVVPFALTLLGISNAADGNPYQASLYYVVLALWVGIALPRGTALALSPLFGAVYWLSLAFGPHAPGLAQSVPYVTAFCILVGETIAWLTARLQDAQRELREHGERRFQAVLAGSSDATIVLSATGAVEYASPSATRALGDDAEGMDYRAIIERSVHPDDAGQAATRIQRLLDGPDHYEAAQFRIRRGDGSWLDVESRGHNLLADEAVRGVVLNLRDVSERKTLERALSWQALHDPLTHLANRALFDDRLLHARSRRQRLAVLVVDLDDFKPVNDRLGHAAGDAALLALVGRLRDAAGPSDTVARLGGDEFAVLVEEAGAEAELVALAQHIRLVLSGPVDADGEEVSVGASIGVAVAPSDAPCDLLADADLAMYAAKRRGKGRVEVYRPQLREALVTRAELQVDLARAVARDELRVVYQPIVDLADGRTLGVEALARWAHPTRGLLGPGEFIAVAEETGLIRQVGAWVLERACHDVRALQRGDPALAGLYVSVNFSPVQLSHDGVVDEVAAALERSGLDPGLLVVEVTESLLLDHGAATAGRLGALKALGVRLAIDDFGAGHSSLRYLRDHPFDMLKVDKGFIDRLGGDATASELVRSIAELGRTLGVEIVAEGVESAGQAETIRLLGYARAQGFHFCRPLAPADLAAFLSADRSHAPAAS